MKKTITVLTCDICKNAQNDSIIQEDKTIPIIFTTEQTEGRGCDPYLSSFTLDICDTCMDIILKGNIPFGSGAQGHNRYSFRL